MPLKIVMQHTPNPFAFKFVLSEDVKSQGKITFRDASECLHIPLARALFAIEHINQVHLFENVITITYDGELTEKEFQDRVEVALIENINNHNPNFQSAEEVRREQLSPEMRKIEEILDHSIRPGLQADGGDIQVVDLHDNVLVIMYEGACGTCPSSTLGTLEAIRGILREEYDPTLEVVTY